MVGGTSGSPGSRAAATALLVVLAGFGPFASAEETTTQRIDAYGPIDSPERAGKALSKAVEAVRKSGGSVEIPSGAPAELEVRSIRQREGEPPVTILDRRAGRNERILGPVGADDGTGNFAGERIRRTLNLGDDGLSLQGAYANLAIENQVVSGSSSYFSRLALPASRGSARRLYVETIRGIYPGQELRIVGPPSPQGEVVRVEAIGWDAQKKRHYFTADLTLDHGTRSDVYDKHIVNSIQIDASSNADNQTPGELFVRRRSYGLGDAFLFSGWLSYMSDINSGYGDEGAVVFNAETIGDLGVFRATVERVDWSDDALVYAAGRTQAHTLSPSRPLINLNRGKWISQGVARVVTHDAPYKGLTSVIVGSKDAPWTADVIGRFFALTDPSEVIAPDDRSFAGGYALLPSDTLHRWYPIVSFELLPDGSKVIRVAKVVWQVVEGVPRLFLDRNYTSDRIDRPLDYAIAPGAWVYDVSEAWADVGKRGGVVDRAHPRRLRLAASAERGTRFDFAPGDPVEQAVGPEPFKPFPVRIRHFDQLPGSNISASIYVDNQARVQVNDAFWISSGTHSRNDLAARKDGRPPYDAILDIRSLAATGISFKDEVLNAAIEFQQPGGHTQPIVWYHGNRARGGRASLEVAPDTGNFVLRGGGLEVADTGVLGVAGLSGSGVAARNLRAIDVPVPVGGRKLVVRFPNPETDPVYAVSVTPSWVTGYGVTSKTPSGFVIEFEKPGPANAKVDWLIVR